jgi:AcrR family transcriptional regulator
MAKEETSAKKPGRPRDPAVEAAVFAAARSLLGEVGYDAVSMEAVAAAAGVGKQTLYRRWPNKAALLVDACLVDAIERVADPATGNLEGDIEQFLGGTFAALETTGPGLRFLMSQAGLDPSFRERFDADFASRRRAALREIICRHVKARRQVGPVIDMIYGAMWYRLFLGHGPLDARFARDLAAAAARALAA